MVDTLSKGRELFSEVLNLMTMFYVFPNVLSIAERSFSSLRRLKKHIRSAMTETRLNNLLVLHVHKKWTEPTDALDVKDAAMQCVIGYKN